MGRAFDELLALLDLEPIEVNLFRGQSQSEGWIRVFGGQVIAQALVAATRTVDPERIAHSLHAYFLRPGDPKIPILYDVDRIRDGKSFTTRRVVAIQRGEAIFSMSVSFHVAEEGLSHQFPMPDVPPPEALASETELKEAYKKALPPRMLAWLERERPLELRPVHPRFPLSPEKSAPIQHVWMKTTGHGPDDDATHRAIMAYASDMSLLSTAGRPHGLTFSEDNVQSASLDHALWFHRPFRTDDWLLYAQDSPSAAGSRGFNRGLIFTRDGTLVASVAQEGLMRIVGRDGRS